MKKHFLLTMVIALASLVCSQAQASTKNVKISGDSITLTNGTDTLHVAASKAIIDKVLADFNTPLIEDNTDDDAIFDSDESSSTPASYYENERDKRRNNYRIVSLVMSIVCFTIVGIVFFCVLFFFLNRRRKYEMIERAIENNYPLPASITGVYPQATGTYQTNATQGAPNIPGTEGQPNSSANYSQPYPYQQAPLAYSQNVPGQYNLAMFKSCICWLVVGLIGTLISICGHNEFFVIIFLIPFTIGVVKALSEFFNQRTRVEHEKWQMQQDYINRCAQQPADDDNVTPPPFQAQ